MRMSVCDLAKLHWGLHQGCCIFSASSNSNQSIVFALFHLAIVFVTTNLLRLECLSPNQSCFSVCSVYILKISHHKHRFPTGVIVYLHWMAIRWVLHSQNCPIMFGCTDTVTPHPRQSTLANGTDGTVFEWSNESTDHLPSHYLCWFLCYVMLDCSSFHPLP